MLWTAIWASFFWCWLKDSQPEVVAEDINVKKDSVECLYTPVVQKQIFVCLDTDDEDSFTHTKVLESLPDQDSSVLELPINQLYKKYKWNSHPLTVSGISKTVWSLIWINNVKERLEEHPQHIEHPEWTEITSNTAYHINDTLRFTLRDPLLQWAFPESLKEQLLEPWFKKWLILIHYFYQT